MTNGVFGRTNDGDSFVIVNDLLVHKHGGFDEVRIMAYRNDDNHDYRVVKLVKDVNSFDQLEKGRGTVIYEEKKENKNEDKSTEELINEINELLDGIQMDAQSKGFSEKEAKNLTNSLFTAASIAALMEMFGERS